MRRQPQNSARTLDSLTQTPGPLRPPAWRHVPQVKGPVSPLQTFPLPSVTLRRTSILFHEAPPGSPHTGLGSQCLWGCPCLCFPSQMHQTGPQVTSPLEAFSGKACCVGGCH